VERSAEQKVQGFGGAVMIIPKEVFSLVEQVSSENWGETYPKLFAALVEHGLTRVETELVLRVAAKRLGVSYVQVWADWQTYLGHDPKEAKPRASDHLRELLEMEEYEVWRAHGTEVWVSVRLNGHVEHWPVRSARTEAWLRRLYGQVYKRLRVLPHSSTPAILRSTRLRMRL
jgi:hypothetical protein